MNRLKERGSEKNHGRKGKGGEGKRREGNFCSWLTKSAVHTYTGEMISSEHCTIG